jgi:hypothetical protein
MKTASSPANSSRRISSVAVYKCRAADLRPCPDGPDQNQVVFTRSETASKVSSTTSRPSNNHSETASANAPASRAEMSVKKGSNAPPSIQCGRPVVGDPRSPCRQPPSSLRPRSFASLPRGHGGRGKARQGQRSGYQCPERRRYP